LESSVFHVSRFAASEPWTGWEWGSVLLRACLDFKFFGPKRKIFVELGPENYTRQKKIGTKILGCRACYCARTLMEAHQ